MASFKSSQHYLEQHDLGSLKNFNLLAGNDTMPISMWHGKGMH